MNKKERLYAAVNGQKPDKVPYSFWSHMPGIDLDPAAISEKAYEFYKKYDFDFIKTMNNGMYGVEDFGCKVDYSEIAKGGVAKIASTPITAPADFRDLTVHHCTEGSNRRELEHLRMVLEKVKGEEVPVIFTVFSPITIADKLVMGGMGSIRKFMEEGYGEEIKAGLEAITETTCEIAKAAIDLGADGIFFACQMSSYDFCTGDQYAEFGVPYDLRVLEAAKGGWLNTIHCHGVNIMFEHLKKYPVNAFNYHAWETYPEPDEAFALTGKCIMGGIARFDITNKNKPAVQHQIFECFKRLQGRNHILTPGCVVRYPLDDDMLSFIGRTRDEVEAVFDAGKILR